MVRVLARVQINQAELQRQLSGPAGMLTQYVMRQTSQVRNRAVMYCPVDTGNLRASITTAVYSEGDSVVGLVGTGVHYGLAVHEGYTTSRGKQVKGRPFLRRALDDVVT